MAPNSDKREVESLGNRLKKHAPVLYVPVYPEPPYRVGRTWGEFDHLGLRGIDDLAFADAKGRKVLLACGAVPPNLRGGDVVAIPAVVALERVFFHLQEIDSISINPKAMPEGLPLIQRGLQSSWPDGFDEPFEISRTQIPALLGLLATAHAGPEELIERAWKALEDNLLFECFYLARTARYAGGPDLQQAWFLELWCMSFLGLPEEALALYEEYPERGSADPLVQLVAARYRLLLKQFNEARTILHTLTFNSVVAARAECELARSFVSTGDFARAVDIASSSLKRDAKVVESYVVRGIAQRGLAYSSGDEEGLRDALKDFEQVATKGGFHAPEASFHAGTVFARLGDLVAAEQSLRQSLFQRDRYSSRDALIRVLAGQGHWESARDESAVLAALAPQATASLVEELKLHSSHIRGSEKKEEGSLASPQESQGELWSPVVKDACNAALVKLKEWRVPVSGSVSDLLLFDDFINRYAPAGEFIAEGEFKVVAEEKLTVVARVIALHSARMLADAQIVTIDEPLDRKLKVTTKTDGHRIHLESFVEERILVGAAGDNVSSLESLVAEAGHSEIPLNGSFLPTWWFRAETEHLEEISQLSKEGRGSLEVLGARLSGALSDLEEIDRVVDSCFEPGGKIEKWPQFQDPEKLARFVVGTGLLVGTIVEQHVPATWFFHPQPEGISLFNADIGRLFPIARMQRRVFLASAADYSAKLSSLSLGVAVAAVLDQVRGGACGGADEIKKKLLGLLPSLGQFSEEELGAVVASIDHLKVSPH